MSVVAILCTTHLRKLLNVAKSALESPLDKIDTRSTKSKALFAGDSGSVETRVLPEILRCHERQLEIILHEHTCDKRSRGSLIGVNALRRLNRGKFSYDLGCLVGFEGDTQFFTVARRVDLDFCCFVGVEGKEFGLETHHVVLLSMNKDL
jgi:hypothetical protein